MNFSVGMKREIPVLEWPRKGQGREIARFQLSSRILEGLLCRPANWDAEAMATILTLIKLLLFRFTLLG